MTDRSDTEIFFEDMFPKALQMNKALFNTLKGSIAIWVEDVGGWTVRFGNYGSPDCYTEGADETADCVMLWEQAAFEKMLHEEPLAPEENPKCTGDERMIGYFVKMMERPHRGVLFRG